MIDEMMLGFDSPGNVSRVFIIALLSRAPTNVRGADTATTTEMCGAGFVRDVPCAPNWLAAESVSAAMAAASLQVKNASAMPMPNNE